MKNVKKIVLYSLFIILIPINNYSSMPLKISLQTNKETLQVIEDDKAAKLGADILTCIAHLCFLYCLIKVIYPSKEETYNGIVYAK